MGSTKTFKAITDERDFVHDNSVTYNQDREGEGRKKTEIEKVRGFHASTA